MKTGPTPKAPQNRRASFGRTPSGLPIESEAQTILGTEVSEKLRELFKIAIEKGIGLK